jgi:hypothetical protein
MAHSLLSVGLTFPDSLSFGFSFSVSVLFQCQTQMDHCLHLNHPKINVLVLNAFSWNRLSIGLT